MFPRVQSAQGQSPLHKGEVLLVDRINPVFRDNRPKQYSLAPHELEGVVGLSDVADAATHVGRDVAHGMEQPVAGKADRVGPRIPWQFQQVVGDLLHSLETVRQPLGQVPVLMLAQHFAGDLPQAPLRDFTEVRRAAGLQAPCNVLPPGLPNPVTAAANPANLLEVCRPAELVRSVVVEDELPSGVQGDQMRSPVASDPGARWRRAVDAVPLCGCDELVQTLLPGTEKRTSQFIVLSHSWSPWWRVCGEDASGISRSGGRRGSRRSSRK